MNETLQKATLLLQNGEPEEALLLLNEVEASTTDGEQLKATCKKVLSEQYLWLLNDAVKNNQTGDIRKYTSKYLYLIGKDERIEKYEKMVKRTSSTVISKQQQIALKDKSHIGNLALIPIVFLLLFVLLSVLWELLEPCFFMDSWVILDYVGSIFYTFYIISATVVLGKVEDKCNANRNFTPQAIWLFVWSGLWLIFTITDMIRGFDYGSLLYLQRKSICLLVGNLSLIVFLVKQITGSFKFKTPLVIAVVATELDIVRLGIILNVVNMMGRPSHNYESFEGHYNIMDFLYYGGSTLMVISFIILFIMSQRTESKQ